MTEQDMRDLAWRLASRSNVLDFETALGIVRSDPAEAEMLIRNREQGEKRQEELSRALKRLRAAARELF